MSQKTPIITLPLKPSSYAKTGMYLSPMFSDMLARKIDGQSVSFLNMLDSYKSQSEYVKLFRGNYKKLGIHPDKMLSDLESMSDLYGMVHSLSALGSIYSDTKTVVTCECGKIDCLRDSMLEITGKTIYSLIDTIKCDICKSECKTSDKEVLLLKNPSVDLSRQFFFPKFSEKDFIEFNTKYSQTNILISKQRETGIRFEHAGKGFNLDVDFFWANYAGLFPGPEKIILGSQRSTFAMFLIGVLDKLHNPGAQTVFVLFPYMGNKHNVCIEDEMKGLDADTRKLYMLYSLKFRDKVSDWSPNALGNVKSMSPDLIAKTHDSLSSELQRSNEDSFYSYVQKSINQLNVQKTIQEIKKSAR